MRRVLIAAVLLSTAAAPPADQMIDRVLASVGGRIVTQSDVRAAREFGLVPAADAADPSRAVLDRLIDRMLMLEEVDRYAPPEPDAGAVRERLAAIRAAFDSPDAYAAALRVSGLDDAALRHWVRNDLRIRAYLDQRFAAVIEPTAEELENYVRQTESDLAGRGETVEASQVRRLARERAVMERRQALIRDWLEGLRRRSSVTYTQGPH